MKRMDLMSGFIDDLRDRAASATLVPPASTRTNITAQERHPA